MNRKTARRSFFRDALAGIAGALGLRAGEAKADESPAWEYRVPWEEAGGNIGGTYGPTEMLRFAIEQHEVHRREGHVPRIERRAVGPWERWEAGERMAAELAR